MARPVNALGFHGMTNLRRPPGKLLDEAGFITPSLVLDAEAMDTGVLRQRRGYRKILSLENCHSLWAGSVMLCARDNVLCRIEGSRVTELGSINGPPARLTYVEAGSRIYIGNAYFQAVYDLTADLLRPWGVPLPPAPKFNVIEGDLAPGVYSLCFTNVVEDVLGGNGDIVQITWEGTTKGIALENLPAGALCWITYPNGDSFFLAEVQSGQIVRQNPWVQPLPTFTEGPPLPFRHFCLAFGRIWGANGKQIYYSEPFRFENFQRGNFIPVQEEPVMVAPVMEGLFINSLGKTWFAAGTDPRKMVLTFRGDGAVPGTLAMAHLEGGGYQISRKASELPTPIWLAEHGFVAGTNTGHLVYLSEGRLKMVLREEGAAAAWFRNGYHQLIGILAGAPITELPREVSFEATPVYAAGAGSGGLVLGGHGDFS